MSTDTDVMTIGNDDDRVERILVFQPLRQQIAHVASFVEESLEYMGCQPVDSMKLLVVVDEILSNIVSYSGASQARLQIVKGEDDVQLIFTDNGKQYNPLLSADPDTTLGVEERNIGGLGIFITKKIADGLEYRYCKGKNILIVKKRTA